MGELDGRIALVTGIAAGMGTGIPTGFAEAGAMVVGVHVHEPGGRAVMERLGPDASFVACGVARVADTDDLVRHVVDTHGRLDVLVNNAGVTKSLGFFDVTEEEADHSPERLSFKLPRELVA